MLGNKEKLVHRILSGYTNLKINGEVYLIHGATSAIKYLAEELYEELLEDYKDDLMDDETLYDWLCDEGLWSIEDETKLADFRKNIEEFQVKLFECGFQGREKAETKKALAFTRNRIAELLERRHKFDYLSASGKATIVKHKYIIGLSVCDKYRKRLFNHFDFMLSTFSLLDRLIIEYNRVTIKTPEFREISRTEPWRLYWAARDATASIFQQPACELTDEQLTLISWSRLYDNVYQHPKCPDDDVIDDDDALDGFLIKDKRERDKGKTVDTLDSITTNPRIRNAQEIYVVAETQEDIDKVNKLNSEASRNIKRRRERTIEKGGKVSELDLPDVKQRLQMQINTTAAAAVKNRTQ